MADEEGVQYKVTWFPHDKAQDQSTTFNRSLAEQKYAYALEMGWAPFWEERTLSPWRITRNSQEKI